MGSGRMTALRCILAAGERTMHGVHYSGQGAADEVKHYRERINKALQQGAAGGRIHKPCALPAVAAGTADVQEGGDVAAAGAAAAALSE